MTQSKAIKIASVAILAFIVLAMLSTVAFAQSVKVNGIIKARAGSTMTMQTADTPNLIVVLTDSTDVAQVEGAFKARKKEMSMAALIPGLACQVEGTYNDKNQLVASKVRFTGQDLQDAQASQAAVHETKVQAAANEAELKQQADALAAQNEALKAQQAALDKQQQEIAANKANIAANSARFGQLDDYYILDEVTVLLRQRPGKGRSEIQCPLAGSGAEGHDLQRLQHSGEGLRLLRRQRRPEPAAQRRARQQRHQHPGPAGSCPLDQHAGPGRDG